MNYSRKLLTKTLWCLRKTPKAIRVLRTNGLGELLALLQRRGRHQRLEPLLLRSALPIVPWPSPWSVQLEISGRCNLNCQSCSTAGQARKDMPVEFVTSVLNSVDKSVDLHLNGIGEPLFHKNIWHVFDLVENHGNRFGFITNGMLLDRTVVQKLSAYRNLRYIGVSFNGGTKEINECSRRGMHFEKVVENTINAVAVLTVEFGIHFTASTENVSHFKPVLELAKRVGIHKVSVAGLYAWDEFLGNLELDYDSFCLINGSEEDIKAQYPDLDISIMLLGRFPKRDRPHCSQPWRFLFVAADGTVYPCCMQFGKRDPEGIGNLTMLTIEKIWNGSTMQQCRTHVHHGDLPACSRCYLR